MEETELALPPFCVEAGSHSLRDPEWPAYLWVPAPVLVPPLPSLVFLRQADSASRRLQLQQEACSFSRRRDRQPDIPAFPL